MFLSKKTIRGIAYLQLVKSEHVAGQRNPRKIVIKNYGRYDKVAKEIREAFEDAQARKELAKKLEYQLRMNELADAHDCTKEESKETSDSFASTKQASSSKDSTNFNKALALNYGHLTLKEIWDKELDLRYKLNYLQEHYTQIDSWNINDVLFYLCSLKIISPSSYLEASESKSNFFYCPWANVTQDNFYKVLDFVYEHHEAILKHAVKSHLKSTKQEIKVAFFDCTNTYFETPYNDVAWQTIRFVRAIKAKLRKEGKSSEEIEQYLDSEYFSEALKAELELRKDEVLRMYGPSKEGRFSQPIVTVALVIDQSGFPIDCKVFAGNTSELKTIHPVLESLKQKYKIKDVYFVADRGLNSAETLNALHDEKLGFVVAQKVSHQTKKLRDEMLSIDGYRNFQCNEVGELVFEQNQTELNENAFRYKVCQHEKISYVANTDKNAKTKRKKITVKCKIVYTFSPERRARDLADLDEQIAKATKAVNEQKLMGNIYGTGWRALIKTKKEAAQNKIDQDQYRATALKDDVIEDKKTVAGYAAIVYDDPVDSSTDCFTAEDVLATYHRLVRIEDCFRVMKNTFSIRPVYVRLKERIIAHCQLCVLSLMLLRSLQFKMEKNNHPRSAERISKALKQALLVPVPSKKGELQMFLNVGLDQGFNTTKREKNGHQQSDLNEVVDEERVWRSYEEERQAQADDLDLILKSVNLTPPNVYNTLGELKIKLGLKTYPNEVMLSPAHLKYQEKLISSL